MTGLNLAPLVPWPYVAAICGFVALLLIVGAWRRGRGMVWRLVAVAVLAGALLNPRLIQEKRESQPDVAVIVVDDSASQNIGDRKSQTAAAVEALRRNMGRFNDLEVREIHTGDGTSVLSDDGTQLFTTLSRALGEISGQRFAGAVVVTDGQVHDAPLDQAQLDKLPGPLHFLVTGSKDEKDRRLIVEKAPSYGIVGSELIISYKIEDQPTPGGGAPATTRLTIRRDGGAPETVQAPIGRPGEYRFSLDHPGPTVLELEADPLEGELSDVNNRAVVSVNGVLDRLRVLLVSGEPHAGERVWRSLLKADPSVDLVHFTILRPPDKEDMTPVRELSLIVFPARQLFEVKLAEFNLVIFDRYSVLDVLPPAYLQNITEYVRNGGALMVAVGPEFAGNRSLFHTPLGAVMPGVPTGQVVNEGFRPAYTDVGRRHPVTDAFISTADENPTWGRWFRQNAVTPRSGVTLLNGTNDLPLLLLDRVGKGRVAELASDQIWLWARGFEGGGPQAELLRRLAHWLMKEPELEEESLRASVERGNLMIRRRSLDPKLPEVKVTTPTGTEQKLALRQEHGGESSAAMPATEPGLYRIEDGTRTALAAAGALNPLEMSDLRATAERLQGAAQATGGSINWLSDLGAENVPELRRVRTGRTTAGRGWIGFKQNEAYVVTGIQQLPVMPALLILGLALAGMMFAWFREGRG
jgi:hypothetical protein